MATAQDRHFYTLATSTPEIKIYNGATLFATRYLAQVGTAIEVTPVCPSQAANTVCSSLLNTIPGVKRYIYEDTITVNTTSANWKFRFTGNMVASSAGRSNSITNINNGSTDGP